MKTFDVKIVQEYSVTREITIQVEAETAGDAAEQIQSEEIIPDFHDPLWEADWDLMDETVSATERTT